MSNEPSMEDILSSIKKIIAEDTEAADSADVRPLVRPAAEPEVEASGGWHNSAARRRPATKMMGKPASKPAPQLTKVVIEPPVVNASPEEDVFELTEFDHAEPSPAQEVPALVSEEAEVESRSAFEALKRSAEPEIAAMPTPATSKAAASVEDLVREMLRPMLKDWLDANLPEIVQREVAKEVARISAGNS